MMATASSIPATMIDAALEYAGKGLPVFPCNPKNKRPITEAGFKDATTDQAIIRRWWSKSPNAIIGMPTGAASGVWVLDVDDVAVFEEACKIALPETRRATTGDGYHLYFQLDPDAPVRNSQFKKQGWPFPDLPGCDVRGDGGYVIVPPSRHPSGRYYIWAVDAPSVPAPKELLAIVRKENVSAPAPTRAVVASAPSTSDDTPYGLAALRDECAAIKTAFAGAQEGTLNDAALKIGALVAGGELTFRTARADLISAGLQMASANAGDPWTPEQIFAKVERGLNDGRATPRKAPERTMPNSGSRPLRLVSAQPANDEGGPDAAQAAARRGAPKRSKADEPDASEDSIALAFTQQHGGNLLFDHNVGRWFRWTGAFWEMDETDLALDFARKLARILGDGERALGRAATAAGVEKLARADRAHAVTSAAWDCDPLLLGTPEGTVDLRTGVLSEPDPADRITKQTGVTPAHGEPTRWLSFLDQSLGGDQELIHFLQLWAGYCLTGLTTAHALLFIFGPGGNGKSVFLNTLLNILGTYGAVAAMETFTASRYDRHSTELAMLRGARLVTASETEEGRAWAEAKIKAMTGGDPITARFMRQDNFTFRPHFKLTIAGNHAPSLKSVDDAMRRRFNIAPFILKPANPDRELEEKLKAEYPQILAWAIAGARSYLASGLTRPAAVVAATDEYFSDQDVFGQWFEERCDETAGRILICADAYADWSSFAKSHGEEPGSLKSFGMQMGRKGYKSALRRDLGIAGKIYQGVALKHREENDAR